MGSDLDADTKKRLALGERIVEVLKQGRNSPIRVGCQVAIVYAVINGYLDSVSVSDVKKYESALYFKLENEHEQWLNRIEGGSFDDEDIASLKKILTEVQV